MNKIKAVIFDFDGTLIDSEIFHYNCWSECLKEHDIHLDYDSYIKNYAGIPIPSNAEAFVKEYMLDISADELAENRESLANERIKTESFNFMPHALRTVQYLHEKGLPLAVVTGSSREDVDIILEKTDLKKYFQFSVTRSEVTNSKPDPESYLKAVERFGYNSAEYLVFEDTLNGIKAAKSAGLTCFAVQENSSMQEKLKIADKVFASFKEVNEYLAASHLF